MCCVKSVTVSLDCDVFCVRYVTVSLDCDVLCQVCDSVTGL